MAMGAVITGGVDIEQLHATGALLDRLLQQHPVLKDVTTGELPLGSCFCRADLSVFWPDVDEFAKNPAYQFDGWDLWPMGQVRCASAGRVGNYWLAFRSGEVPTLKGTVSPYPLIGQILKRHMNQLGRAHAPEPWTSILRADNYAAFTLGEGIKTCWMGSSTETDEQAMLRMLSAMQLEGRTPRIESETPTRSYQIRADRSIKNLSKTQRNDPCPCGSKRKFKKCCLRRSS